MRFCNGVSCILNGSRQADALGQCLIESKLSKTLVYLVVPLHGINLRLIAEQYVDNRLCPHSGNKVVHQLNAEQNANN